jgi:aspartyl-tRNA(Asn)/glutamyl-tRNA(Gln) amidotransferase subunit A
LRNVVDTALDEYGVLALPTTPITAPLLNQTTTTIGGAVVDTRGALLSLTSPWNLTGHPAISIPGGIISGLPFGIQLITRPGNEATLFATASRVERISAQQNGR